MSVDPAFALQKAIYKILNGATEAGENVYDRVPPGNSFPRIVIGEAETTNRRIGTRKPKNGPLIDHCFYAGSETTLFIDVFGGRDAEIGFPETKRIADQVRDILDDADLDLSAYGHRLEMLDFETTAHQADADGITRRALMVFRVWTQAL